MGGSLLKMNLFGESIASHETTKNGYLRVALKNKN